MTMTDRNDLDPEFLDSDDGVFLSWAHSQYQREIDLQYESRTLKARDADYYDGDQFTEEEKQEYLNRGQKARVFNEAKPTIDWILGGESRARLDWRVLPREEDDVKPALSKTKLMKYIDDINKAKWQRSQAYKDMVVTGKGWMRVCLEPNVDGQMEVVLRYEHWLNILEDSASRQPDMSDMRYLFVTKILDIDTPCAWFPDKAKELKAEAGQMEQLIDNQNWEGIDRTHRNNGGFGSSVRHGSMSLAGGTYGCNRQAIRVYEIWYRKTEQVEVLRGKGRFSGELYDAENLDHKDGIASGKYKSRKTVREQMYCAIFTETTVLYRARSPYKHNRFPYVQRVAYIKDLDGSSYGVMRSIIDPQSDLNVRRNHALNLMVSTAVVMDEGAVDDVAKLEREVGQANSVTQIKKGARFDVTKGSALATQHLQMSHEDSAYIREVSGVTGENRGLNTNATSGIAIQARQEQGTIITNILIDRHSLGRQMEGELTLSLVEQYMDEEFQFRINGDKMTPEFVSINDGTDDTDITAMQSDFIVSEQDYRQTMRQAFSEQIMTVAGNVSQKTGDPRLSVAMIEMAIDMQDLPEKDRWISSLRDAAGLPPHDETDEQKQAREQQVQQQQQAQQQAQQEQMRQQIEAFNNAQALTKATIAEKMSGASNKNASTSQTKIETAGAAYAAAAQVVATPQLSETADYLMKNVNAIVDPISQEDEQLQRQAMQQQEIDQQMLQQDQQQVQNQPQQMQPESTSSAQPSFDGGVQPQVDQEGLA